MKITKQRFSKQILATILIYPLLVMTLACSVDTVLSDIDLVLQTAASLETAIGAVSPADAAALQLLTGVAISGVNAIKTAYDTYEKDKTASNLQNVVAAAQAVLANLPQELASLHITDPNAVAKATAWVSLVVDTVQAIATAVGGVSISHGAKSTTYNSALITPETLQLRWQNEVCKGDVACGALVKIHHRHSPRKWAL